MKKDVSDFELFVGSWLFLSRCYKFLLYIASIHVFCTPSLPSDLEDLVGVSGRAMRQITLTDTVFYVSCSLIVYKDV